MASKDSVRYFGQSLTGLGDRLSARAQRDIENARSEKSLGLQQRYADMAQSKFGEEQKQRKRQDAVQAFVSLQQLEQQRLGGEKFAMDAAKNVFAKLKPEQRAMLPPEMTQVLGLSPEPSVPGSVGPSSWYRPPYPVKEKVFQPPQDPTIDLIRRMKLQQGQ